MMTIGYVGREIGEILNAMLDKVDDDKLINDRKSLLEYASQGGMK